MMIKLAKYLVITLLAMLTTLEVTAVELGQFKSFDAGDRKNYVAGIRDGVAMSQVYISSLVSDNYPRFVEQAWVHECITIMNVEMADASALAASFDHPEERVSTWFNRFMRQRCKIEFEVVHDWETENSELIRTAYVKMFPDRTDSNDGYTLWNLFQSIEPEKDEN